ncbi:hypothetical protein M406DRAFT_264227, partial [Cryphonectria parasitica EP155]
DVDPMDFDLINCETRRPKVRLRRYDAKSRILFITIPSRLHEAMHSHIYQKISFQIFGRGLEDRWSTMAATTCYTKPNSGAGDGSGEGDSSGGPSPERDGPNAWPTLVIEAGYSESQQYLRQDMRWWLAASDHDVKIVLLIKWDRRRSEISIERWEEDIPVQRPGATNTRSTGILALVLRQIITITKNPTVPPTFSIVSSALVLPFRLLFLRNPGPGESDFVLSVQELEGYARAVWRSMG